MSTTTNSDRRFKLNQMLWVYDEHDQDYSEGQVTKLLKKDMVEIHFWEEDTGKPTTYAKYHEDHEHLREKKPKAKSKARKRKKPRTIELKPSVARPAKKKRKTGARREAARLEQEADQQRAKDMASAALHAAMQREKNRADQQAKETKARDNLKTLKRRAEQQMQELRQAVKEATTPSHSRSPVPESTTSSHSNRTGPSIFDQPVKSPGDASLSPSLSASIMNEGLFVSEDEGDVLDIKHNSPPSASARPTSPLQLDDTPPPPVSPTEWVCSECTLVNEPTVLACAACFKVMSPDIGWPEVEPKASPKSPSPKPSLKVTVGDTDKDRDGHMSGDESETETEAETPAKPKDGTTPNPSLPVSPNPESEPKVKVCGACFKQDEDTFLVHRCRNCDCPLHSHLMCASGTQIIVENDHHYW